MELQITIRGASTAELLKNLGAAQMALTGNQDALAASPAPKAKKTKAAPVVETAPVEEPVQAEVEEIETFGEETTDADELGFDSEEATEEPAKPAKATKAAKLTEKDVNNAALAHAKKHGRPATLKILQGTFKVKSILELKPELYAKVIAALKV